MSRIKDIRKYVKSSMCLMSAALVAAAILLCGCGKDTEDANSPIIEQQIVVTRDENITKPEKQDQQTANEEETEDSRDIESAEPEILVFRDVFGEEYETVINPDIPSNPFDNDKFIHEGDILRYDDEGYDCKLGIDVSHHQGNIDWESVKAQGYDFAILRIGYRGYGKEGTLNRDQTFEENYENARAAGLSVGVYFFAQAVSEEEAAEEAEFVLGILNGRDLELPVVYDPESILDDEARTDDVSGEQFTKNTKEFCRLIKEAGYVPMIYSNMLWEAFELDLEQLSDIDIWYADYEDVPQTPYDFDFWQYSNTGNVAGVSGEVDLDIWLKPKNE